MSQHFSGKGHLELAYYDQVESVEYIELPSKIDMDIKELYYINIWKPMFNTMNKQTEKLSFTINEKEDRWKVFKTKLDSYIEEIEKENRTIKNNYELLFNDLTKLNLDNTNLKNDMRKLLEEKKPVTINANFNALTKINTNRLFSIQEMLDILECDSSHVFYSTLTNGYKTIAAYTIFKENGIIKVEESVTGQLLRYEPEKIDFNNFAFYHNLEICETFLISESAEYLYNQTETENELVYI